MDFILVIGIANTLATLLWVILCLKLVKKTNFLSKQMNEENHLRDRMIADVQEMIDSLKVDVRVLEDDMYKTQKEVVKLIPPSFDEMWREKKRRRETGALDVSMPLPDFPGAFDTIKGTCSEVPLEPL
jgi:hypothetical protein